MKWTRSREEGYGSAASENTPANIMNNVDTLMSNSYDKVFVNNNTGDSGIHNYDQCVQSDNAEYRDSETQCTRYDICTSPVVSAETQTSRAHKSHNIQVDGFPLKDKSTQANVERKSVLSNTTTVMTTDKFTIIHRDFLNASSQTCNVIDQSCQVSVDNETKQTTTRDLTLKGDHASQTTHPFERTDAGTMTEDLYESGEAEYDCDTSSSYQNEDNNDYSYYGQYYDHYDRRQSAHTDGYNYYGNRGRWHRNYYSNY